MTARPPTPTNEPSRLFGRYQAVAELGKGGMGVVYRGWDPSLERHVAIKAIKNPLQAGAQHLARFEREARAVARLDHPNVVSVFEIGTKDKMPFIVMELVEGQSLNEVLAAGLPWQRAVEMARDIAAALHHVHQHGVIHRDVKPQNILVEASTGKPLLTDFGLVHDELSDENLTTAGQLLGTPAYMAPEQADESFGKVGPASDVYGLGSVLYKCLSGRAPFGSTSNFAIMRQMLMEPPKPLQEVAPHIPAELSDIVHRCLQKDPTARFPSADALSSALSQWMEAAPTKKQSTAPRRVSSRKPRGSPAAPSQDQDSEEDTPTSPALKSAALLGATFVLGMIVAGIANNNASAPIPVQEPIANAGPIRVQLQGFNEPLTTNNEHVTISGTIQAGTLKQLWIHEESVQVFDGGFEHELTLEDGEHVIEVKNAPRGDVLAQAMVLVDTTGPRLEAFISKGSIVSRQNIEMFVRSLDGDLASASVAGEVFFEPDESGEVTIPVQLRSVEGRQTLSLVGRDHLGNESNETIHVTLDLSPPDLVLTQLTLVAHGPRYLQLQVDGAVLDDHPEALIFAGHKFDVGSDGKFSAMVELHGEGPWLITVIAEDALGHRSAPKITLVDFDVSPPKVLVDSPAPGLITTETHVVIRGRVRDSTALPMVQVGTLQIPLDDKGSFVASIDLSEGENTIEITSMDQKGLKGQATVTIIRDTTPPTIRFDPQIPDVYTEKSPEMVINGEVNEDGCQVIVNDEEVPMVGRRFTTKVRLYHRGNRIEVIATDPMGNETRFKTVVRRRLFKSTPSPR